MNRTADPRGLLALLLALAAPAAAREGCEPLDEPGLRDLLVQLRAGIDRGDEVLPAQVIDEIHARIPCLAFAPTPRQWAEVLVGEAVVAYFQGEPWEAAMSTALWIHPGIDRGVSSRHPLATWEPPAPPPPGPPVAPGARIYVDGVPSDHLPPAAGAHLVQRTDGRFWNSIRVVDAPVPEGWAEAPVAPPPHLATGLVVDLALGTASVSQETSWSSDWLRAGERRGVAPEGSIAGRATFWSPFGVAARASTSTWGPSPGADLHAAGIWTWRGLLFGAGVGTATVDIFEGAPAGSPLAEASGLAEVHRLHLVRYALGTAELRFGRATTWRAAALAGGSPACLRARLELAAELPERGGTGRWRIGLGGDLVEGHLAPEDAPDERLVTRSARVALRVGRAWGEL